MNVVVEDRNEFESVREIAAKLRSAFSVQLEKIEI